MSAIPQPVQDALQALSDAADAATSAAADAQTKQTALTQAQHDSDNSVAALAAANQLVSAKLSAFEQLLDSTYGAQPAPSPAPAPAPITPPSA